MHKMSNVFVYILGLIHKSSPAQGSTWLDCQCLSRDIAFDARCTFDFEMACDMDIAF